MSRSLAPQQTAQSLLTAARTISASATDSAAAAATLAPGAAEINIVDLPVSLSFPSTLCPHASPSRLLYTRIATLYRLPGHIYTLLRLLERWNDDAGSGKSLCRLADVCPSLQPWDWASNKSIGMCLGNVLILEKWMSPDWYVSPFLPPKRTARTRELTLSRAGSTTLSTQSSLAPARLLSMNGAL